MNKVEELFKSSKTASDFSAGYFNYLSTLFSRIDCSAIQKFVEIILDARERGANVFFIGNGGSAATASHFANDIAIGTRTKGKPFRIISLTDNNAVMTAIGNDFGYDSLFTKQLESLMNPNDVVVAISASGNSPNVINAIEYANKHNCTTIGLTGFSGGKLKEIAKLALHVPSDKGEYGPVEDLHMIFDHIIGNYLALYCKHHD